MKKAIKAIIVGSEDRFAEILCEQLNRVGILSAVVRGSREQLKEIIVRECADAVIIEGKVRDLDVEDFINKCHEILHKAYFVVLGSGSESLKARLGSHGFVTENAADIREIRRRILDACFRRENRGVIGRECAERYADKMLREAGVTVNLRGYHYLVRAASIAVNVSEAVYDMGSDIYEVIAEERNVRVSSVERAVRLTLRLALDRGNREFMNEAFGGSVCDNMGEEPAGSRFIEYISHRIRERIIKEADAETD